MNSRANQRAVDDLNYRAKLPIFSGTSPMSAPLPIAYLILGGLSHKKHTPCITFCSVSLFTLACSASAKTYSQGILSPPPRIHPSNPTTTTQRQDKRQKRKTNRFNNAAA